MKNKEYMNNLPIYDAFIDEFDELSGIKFISLVDSPAIEIKGFCFNNDTENNYKLSINKEKQIIAGPAMIPNKLIIREDENGNPFYIRFSKDVVKSMFDKFMRNNNNRSINLDHTNRMVPGIIEQFWYVSDPIYDKSRIYGYNLPVGTPFLEVHIEDKEFWDSEVKDLGQSGFSIEGNFAQKIATFSSEKNWLDGFVDSLTDEDIMEIIGDLK